MGDTMENLDDIYENLYELTGQESGIVMDDDGNVIVCYWAGTDGIPHVLNLWSDAVIGLGESFLVTDEREDVCIENLFSYDRLVYAEDDFNMSDLLGFAHQYIVVTEDNKKYTVYAPHLWN